MTSLPYYYFVQIFIGIFNAFLLPCLIAIMGNWFPKKNRGLIVGLWATCNNFGNIAGIQLAAALIDDVFEKKWQWLMVLASVLGLIITIVVWFYLIPHPSLVGIHVEEMTQKEAILTTVAQDKEVF
jgi:sugar phosphate permease